MSTKQKLKSAAIVAVTLTISACVSTQTVAEKQVSDSELACNSIATRIGEVRSARNYAKANRGVSGANVAAALFFWPALLVNNSNTSSMIKSMDARESVLVGYYENKQCKDTIPEYDNAEIKKKIKAKDTLESFS